MVATGGDDTQDTVTMRCSLTMPWLKTDAVVVVTLLTFRLYKARLSRSACPSARRGRPKGPSR